MVYTNPESALYNLDIIQKNDRFKDTLTPKELETLKTEAKARKEALDKWHSIKEITEHFTKTNLIFKQIQTGELINYDDIVNALIDANTDEYTSRYLLKQAGYSGELPPDLKEHIEEVKIIEKETNKNILNNKNINNKNIILNNKNNNDNSNYNTDNNNYYDKIDFSKSDKDQIKNILTNRGLPINKEELKNNSKAEKEYYRIANNLLENYIASANYIFTREKQNRPDKYRDTYSWLDFVKEMNKNKRKEFYAEALRISLDAFANGISVEQKERNISRDKNKRPLTREESIEAINNYYNDVMTLETIELINE